MYSSFRRSLHRSLGIFPRRPVYSAPETSAVLLYAYLDASQDERCHQTMPFSTIMLWLSQSLCASTPIFHTLNASPHRCVCLYAGSISPYPFPSLYVPLCAPPLLAVCHLMVRSPLSPRFLSGVLGITAPYARSAALQSLHTHRRKHAPVFAVHAHDRDLSQGRSTDRCGRVQAAPDLLAPRHPPVLALRSTVLCPLSHRSPCLPTMMSPLRVRVHCIRPLWAVVLEQDVCNHAPQSNARCKGVHLCLSQAVAQSKQPLTAEGGEMGGWWGAQLRT